MKPHKSKTIFVDLDKGNDKGTGGIDSSYRTFEKALGIANKNDTITICGSVKKLNSLLRGVLHWKQN